MRKFEIEMISPLVRDHNRIGRDMIVGVEIITSRLVREALTRYECQLVTIMLEKDLPSGNTGFHLEKQLTQSNG